MNSLNLHEELNKIGSAAKEEIHASLELNYFNPLKDSFCQFCSSRLLDNIIENQSQERLKNIFDELQSVTKQKIVQFLLGLGLNSDAANSSWILTTHEIKDPKLVVLKNISVYLTSLNQTFASSAELQSSSTELLNTRGKKNSGVLIGVGEIAGGVSLLVAAPFTPFVPGKIALGVTGATAVGIGMNTIRKNLTANADHNSPPLAQELPGLCLKEYLNMLNKNSIMNERVLFQWVKSIIGTIEKRLEDEK